MTTIGQAAADLAGAARAGATPDRLDLEVVALAERPADVLEVASYAAGVRERARPGTADLCGLASAKTGACPEDCSWCAQAARYRTGSPVHAMQPVGDLLGRAKQVELTGAARVCLVASGRSPSEREMETVCRVAAQIRKKTNLNVCACLGTADEPRLKRLRDSGVTRYNHNLESSRNYFPSVCRTHSWDERRDTAEAIRRSGLELCSGGIVGMGETTTDRLDLLMSLRELDPAVVPVNVLNPRPGTPLGGARPMTPLMAVLWIAIARLVLPKAVIKVAGGREAILREFQGLALLAGADGMIVGGYLTTPGRPASEDLRMAVDAGLSDA